MVGEAGEWQVDAAAAAGQELVAGDPVAEKHTAVIIRRVGVARLARDPLLAARKPPVVLLTGLDSEPGRASPQNDQ